LRWFSVKELRDLDLLPARIKSRLLRDAPGGWTPEEIYLGGSGD
jgi:hypothetical protein